ncbi:competence protein ComEC [Austwickia chelonae]|nr:ComEC/Rec2 family competence protein [Austwickia chelonae]SEW07886.1 competence protein ComEC [Austwickia chelonae]
MRLVVPAVAGWVSLVVMLPHRPITVCASAGAAACLGAATWWWRSGGRWTAPVTAAAVVTAVLLSAGAAGSIVRESGGLADLAGQKAVVTLQGALVTDPRRTNQSGDDGPARWSARVQVDQVEGRGTRRQVNATVLVIGSTPWAERRWQEKVRFTGRLAPAEPGQDVVALVTAQGTAEVLDAPGVIADLAEHVRSSLRSAAAALPGDAPGLLPGLVIGDTGQASERLIADMKVTGMTHLSAVSGSNVAIVLAAALALARGCRLPRRFRPAVAALLLAGFVVMARPEPSVIRAAVMGAVGLMGVQTSRKGGGLPALGAAMVLLLLIDPWLARSYGFALSVTATAGLLVFAGPWSRAIARRLPDRLAFLGEMVAIPVAAHLACAPLIVLLSGSISMIGVVANIVAAPLVAPATVLGVAAAVLSSFHVGVGSVVAWAAAIPVLGIAEVAHRCARVPFASIPWPGGVGGALLLGGLTVAGIAMLPWLREFGTRRPSIVVGVLVLVVAAVFPARMGPWPHPQWSFVACDVGQGDALVIRSGEGSAVLVDTGPVDSRVGDCLTGLRVERLDAVVLTHLDRDHSGSIDQVLRDREVGELLLGVVDEPEAEFRRISGLAAGRGLPLRRLAPDEQLTWSRAQAQVRLPAVPLASGSVTNNNSVVLDVRVDRLRLLLLADVEREAGTELRRRLSREGVGDPVDVVKVAHHGSANHDPELLEKLAPRSFVISVGARNTFGHPAPSLMSTLARVGAPVYRTDQGGDILFCVVEDELAVMRPGA